MSARPAMLLVAVFLVPGPVAPQSKPTTPSAATTRSVFVSVLDRGGAPVADLGPSDFEISEGGVKRQVVRAQLATSPMRIAVLADTSDGATPALNHMRAALPAFADAVAAPHELMLVSTGRQMRVRVQPTSDRKKFKDAASGLFPDGGATPLMNALLEVDDRFMRKADDRWPVFVIITSDGPEGSQGANEKKFNEWVAALPLRGVAAHAVVLKYKGGGMPEIIANSTAVTAGGVYEYINTSNSLADKLHLIAERIAGDYERVRKTYEVSFATDTTNGPVMVGVARDGIRLETTQGRLR